MTLLDAFLALQLSALCGLFLILATIIASGRITKRHPIWINFIVSWIISCTSYLLLIGHPLDWKPPRALCYLQAVLVYTVPSLTAGATLALLIHVLIFFRVTFTSPNVSRPSTRWYILLLAVPYVPAFGMLFLSLGIAVNDPGTIQRASNRMYCNMKNEYPGKISAILVTLFMIACVVLEVLIYFNLRRNWNAIRNEMFTHMKGTIVRIFAFTISTIACTCLGLLFFFQGQHGPQLDLVIAAIPVIAALIFGSQNDIIVSWVNGFRWVVSRFACCRSTTGVTSRSREGMIGMTTLNSKENHIMTITKSHSQQSTRSSRISRISNHPSPVLDISPKYPPISYHASRTLHRSSYSPHGTHNAPSAHFKNASYPSVHFKNPSDMSLPTSLDLTYLKNSHNSLPPNTFFKHGSYPSG